MFQSIATLCVNKFVKKKQETRAERGRNACRKGPYSSRTGKHGGQYET